MFALHIADFTKLPEFNCCDSYETLKQAVDDYSRCGWEEMEKVIHTAIIIKDDSEIIKAVGVYVNSSMSSLPVLLWVFSEGTMEQRYYETEYLRFIDSEQEVYND
ncbi:hypothetical protein QUF70_17470 [Desulfobacterales bacterium HSG17]|nr:hypothetical protein [Desulfobacterales bacterium HSG17]